MRGRRITTLRQLMDLAAKRQAVTGDDYIFHARHQPAAWVVNMNGAQIIRLIDRGLYHHRRAKP